MIIRHIKPADAEALAGLDHTSRKRIRLHAFRAR